MKLEGAFVALVTPFKDDLSVDYEKLDELVEFQIKNGIDGIVVCGTTAETPTLSLQEYKNIISKVVAKVNKRVTVIAGASSNNTEKAVELTNLCKEIGVDAVLSAAPFYNKPSQRGIIEHFKKIASQEIPVVIYNIPSRTGVNISPETVHILSEIDNIVGIKEASGIVEQMIEIRNLCKEDFKLFSGEDHLIMPLYSVGCKGVISVLANILPDKLADFYKKPTFDKHKYLYDLSKNMFIEGNPVTVKEAMNILGLCKNNVRLPLVKATSDTREKLKKLLTKKGIN